MNRRMFLKVTGFSEISENRLEKRTVDGGQILDTEGQRKLKSQSAKRKTIAQNLKCGSQLSLG